MPTENSDPRINPRAGKLPTKDQLVNPANLVSAYSSLVPDPAVAAQHVAFGTSGHRGSSFARNFNEAHVLAISQAICRCRQQADTSGPLFSAAIGRRLYEVPVGFKHFVDSLLDGSLGFGGEESAGASFLRCDGTVWTTDKDGIAAALLSAEITARNGRTPDRLYRDLERDFGASSADRIDAPATPEQKRKLSNLAPEQ